MAIVVPIVSTWEPRGLQKSIRDIQKAEGAWGKTGAAMKALRGPAIAVGGAVAAGAAVSIKAASDLGETFNAVEKTFGKASGTITDFGKVASTQAGLSQRAFQELATTTGALLTNMGYSQDAAAESTVNLAKRAADMASVFNTDVGTALEAINAGLRGESEPLRAFGVGLSDAALRAYAAEKGIKVSTGALTANEKALLSEGLILQQTSKYAGDFADTSDSLANSQRTLGADLENLSAELGTVLLPYAESFVQKLRDMAAWASENQGTVKALVGVLGGFAAVVLATNAAMSVWNTATILVNASKDVLNSRLVLAARLTARATLAVVKDTVALLANRAAATAVWLFQQAQLIPGIIKASAAWVAQRAIVVANTAAMVAWNVAAKVVRAATIAWTAVQWALNVALNANPIGLIVMAIALLIGAVVLAYKKSDTFRAIVDGLWKVLKGAFLGAIKAVSGAFQTFVGWLSKAYQWIKDVLAKVGELGNKLSGGLLGKLGGLFGGRASVGVAVSNVSGPGARSARAAGGVMVAGGVTINILGSNDPFRTGAAVKRMLEGNDVAQGRKRGAPLALAW